MTSSSNFEVALRSRLIEYLGMGKPYGQYCPIALTSEILGERWTILVVMALADGFSRFSDIQRTLPRISASTLTQRLRSLEDAGVLVRNTAARDAGGEYTLTAAGLELGELVYGLGRWGHRWGRDLETDDLDPHHLMWSIHMRINLEIMPAGRTTIAFRFRDVPADKRFFWIVVNNKTVDACLKHPGYLEDLVVHASIGSFVDAWRGFSSITDEIKRGRIEVSGQKQLVKKFPSWLLLSMIADEKRMRVGREKTLQQTSHPHL